MYTYLFLLYYNIDATQWHSHFERYSLLKYPYFLIDWAFLAFFTELSSLFITIVSLAGFQAWEDNSELLRMKP